MGVDPNITLMQDFNMAYITTEMREIITLTRYDDFSEHGTVPIGLAVPGFTS